MDSFPKERLLYKKTEKKKKAGVAVACATIRRIV
jgi:hypothetical protein